MRTRQKQRKLSDIVGLANAARAAFSETVLACLLRRGVVGLGELLEQRDDAVGLHHARVDDVDVDVVAIADSGKPLCKIRKGGVHPPIRKSGPGVLAAAPIMLMTLPGDALSSGQNNRDSRTAAKYFSANPSTNASSGSSKKLPPRVAPALLTRMSQRLNFSLTALNSCSQPASVLRSPATVIGAGPPAIVLAAAARLSALAAAKTTCAPSRAN